MNFKCERCEKQFRDAWNLNTHMSRKFPCILKNEQKDSLGEQKDSLGEQNCKWCLKTYFNTGSLNRHIKTCKLVDDPIRKLEMEQSIKIDLNQPVCRFCNKTFTRTSSSNKHQPSCESKGAYIDKLKSANVKSVTVNNGTINNGTINNTNNVTINVFGKESMATDSLGGLF